MAETDVLNARGDCMHALAKVLAGAGPRPEAVQMRADAIAEYREGDLVCVRRAEDLQQVWQSHPKVGLS